MNKKTICSILLFSGILCAQSEIARLSQMNRIFFITEINGLTANIVNPAGLSIKQGDDGFLFGYDFVETDIQGNSFVSLSMGNLGLSYQDIYSYSGIRLQNYAVNISLGGEFLAVATSNKIVAARYFDYTKSVFNVDASFILRPAKSVSIGFVARNLGEPNFDSLDFKRNYTAGLGIFLLNNVLQIFGEFDFTKNDEVNKNVSGSAGIVLQPVDIFELRAGAYRNPEKVYEGFLAFSFLIENSFRVMASARFNENRERTRYSAIIILPLQTVKF